MNNVFSSVLYIMCMGFGYPIIRYVSRFFKSSLNMNATMFIAGGVVFIVTCLIYFRDELKKYMQQPKLLLYILALAIFTSGNMYCFITGLIKTSSLAGSVFGILSMPFSILVASIFYLDEREKVKQPKFLIGSCITIVGSFIFISNSISNNGENKDYLLGILLLSCTILFQAMQSLVVKSASKKIHSMAISSASSLTTGVLFLLISSLTNQISEFQTVSISHISLVAVTGIFASFVGMILTFYIIQKQGVVILNILKLIIPPTSGICGYLFLKEQISIIQIIGTIVILTGCVLALNSSNNKK